MPDDTAWQPGADILPPGETTFDATEFFASLEGRDIVPATTQAVNTWAYPYSTVVFVMAAFPNNPTAYYGGSGVMVGRNDVLTAGHVIYDYEKGGYATSIMVVPLYTPETPGSPIYGPFPATGVIDAQYPTLGLDATVLPGDGQAGGRVGSELDWGFLTLSVPLGDYTGVMYLDTSFTSGPLYQTGYPDRFGAQLVTDYQNAAEAGVDNFIDIRAFETSGGNSGGPLWRFGGGEYANTAFVAGIVSTADGNNRGVAAFDVDDYAPFFQQMVAANDTQIVA